MAFSEDVDPFIGTGVTALPPSEGLAARWWFPKPQVGNTHPGAVAPLGMVSACAYSGAYPTGYGRHLMSTEGVPPTMYDDEVASGFTHFQQSGTGAIRKYYNYFRITPMIEPLDELGRVWPLADETAEPGYYASTLGPGIRCELTAGPKSVVHRYTFAPVGSTEAGKALDAATASVVIDFSAGGLEIEHGETVPMRAHLQTVGANALQGEVVVEGVPLSVYIECVSPGWRQMLWYDRRLMSGGSRLDFDSIRQTTLRTFGSLFRGPIDSGPGDSGSVVEVRVGFSLRGVAQAQANLRADLAVPDHVADAGPGRPAFDSRRKATAAAWNQQLSAISVEGGSHDQRTIFATALYHSLVKPSFAPDESPFWPSDGPFVFDICTMWDIYKTQLPLFLLIAPDKADELLQALLQISAEEGNLPIGYRMARGADRFFRQASALAHTFFADACAAGVGTIDWEWALVHLSADLRRSFGEDFLVRGVAHPISHTLDLAYGYHCTAQVARSLGDQLLAEDLDGYAAGWPVAFDPDTGLLVDSSFYEGGRWNYSFRLLHDMAGRIELAGGEAGFVEMLDEFFGFDAPPVTQIGLPPFGEELEAGYELNRFEGLNNEPDIEAPWAYHYAGRPDRTSEIVHAIIKHQFAVGRGGLPGNDDSGGLSSWYVWASLGLFPVAGQNIFLINTPAFARSTVSTGTGQITISTVGFTPLTDAPGPQYITAASLDGVDLDRTWITGNELRDARELRLTLADAPAGWADSSRPPSVSTTDPTDSVRPTTLRPTTLRPTTASKKREATS